MNGPSVVRSRQRRFSGRKPLRRCQNRVEEENLVLIDEETDNRENVFVIDITESLPTEIGGETDRLRIGKKAATSCPAVVICLDDDDQDMDDQVDGDCVMNEGNAKNGCSSTRKSNTPISTNIGRSSSANINGCQFDQENVSPPLKLSKGKRTYSGKTYTGNRFGVYDVDDLSCDDVPDCELMEDRCGSVKEMWEKAYTKRKCDSRNCQHDLDDSNKDTYDSRENVKTSTDCGQCDEPPPVTKPAEHKGEASSIPNNKGNSHYTADESLSSSAHDGVEDFFLDSNLRSRFSYTKRLWNFQNGQPDLGDSNKDTYDSCVNAKTSTDCRQWEEPPPVTRQAGHEGETSSIRNNKGNSQYTADESLNVSSHDEVEDFFYDSILNSRFSYTKRKWNSQNGKPNLGDFNKGTYDFCENAKTSTDCENAKPSSFTTVQNGMNIRKESFQFDTEHLNGWSSIFHSNRNDVHSPNSLNQQDDQTNDSMNGQNDETVHNNEFVMVSDREKLKETEEYKKATEEEWASRQRTLQIQAEEAQNLRRIQKRRKAETMRVLDMEKRQKQRLVEIQENEKKDRENSNLRDMIRAEVLRDLNKLEVTCRDMASLLQALGIPIGGGLLYPSLSQVRSAYKRAVLAFHPDRASRSDMRQQVEAEEKFKLIFRMKEKFLPSL